MVLKPRPRACGLCECLRAVRFTMVLKQWERCTYAYTSLRAVRFTRALKPIMRPTHIAPCLRAVRFTMVLKPEVSCICSDTSLRAVLFMRDLQSAHAYCWLDYHASYKTPLILNAISSVNYSDIPMLDVCDGSQRVSTPYVPNRAFQWLESCAVYDGTQTSFVASL